MWNGLPFYPIYFVLILIYYLVDTTFIVSIEIAMFVVG